MSSSEIRVSNIISMTFWNLCKAYILQNLWKALAICSSKLISADVYYISHHDTTELKQYKEQSKELYCCLKMESLLVHWKHFPWSSHASSSALVYNWAKNWDANHRAASWLMASCLCFLSAWREACKTTQAHGCLHYVIARHAMQSNLLLQAY